MEGLNYINDLDIQKMAKKYDKKKTTVDKTGKNGVSFGEVPDSYAECYPSMQYEVREGFSSVLLSIFGGNLVHVVQSAMDSFLCRPFCYLNQNAINRLVA